MKLKEKIQELLTRWYLKARGARLKGRMNYRYGIYSKEVFIYSSKSMGEAQATPWNTIIIPEVLFTKYSKNARDFIFLHEYGHTRLSAVLRAMFYIFMVPLFFLFLGSIAGLMIIPTFLLLKGVEPISVLFIFVAGLLLTTILGLSVMAINWASEIHAEKFAIEAMGEEKYLEAIREVKRKAKRRNLFSRAFHALLYPPHRVVILLYKKTCKTLRL